MSLSLTWTDAQDGTGGTATVSGAGSGDTVQIYAQQVSLTVPGGSWTLAGSCTGNGTVSLSLSVGYWWLYALDSTANTLSQLIYALASDDSLAVHERFVQGLKGVIQGLSMAGSPTVYDQLYPNDKVVQFPCILLTVEGLPETQPGTLTGKDDIGYPVRISVVDRNDVDYTANRPKYLLWRQQIFRAIRNQKVPGIPENTVVFIEPDVVVDRNLPAYAYYVSGMVARCVSREKRGV